MNWHNQPIENMYIRINLSLRIFSIRYNLIFHLRISLVVSVYSIVMLLVDCDWDTNGYLSCLFALWLPNSLRPRDGESEGDRVMGGLVSISQLTLIRLFCGRARSISIASRTSYIMGLINSLMFPSIPNRSNNLFYVLIGKLICVYVYGRGRHKWEERKEVFNSIISCSDYTKKSVDNYLTWDS